MINAFLLFFFAIFYAAARDTSLVKILLNFEGEHPLIYLTNLREGDVNRKAAGCIPKKQKSLEFNKIFP